MTNDEAIEREEALAYSFGERWKRLGEPVGDLPKLEAEHRQMAEWLRELKEVKALVSVTEKIWHHNARGGLIDVVDGYDILFSEHKQLREMFEADANEEEREINDE